MTFYWVDLATSAPEAAKTFGVEDCDRAVATAQRLGGSIVMDPMEVEKVGRFAFLGDP